MFNFQVEENATPEGMPLAQGSKFLVQSLKFKVVIDGHLLPDPPIVGCGTGRVIDGH